MMQLCWNMKSGQEHTQPRLARKSDGEGDGVRDALMRRSQKEELGDGEPVDIVYERAMEEQNPREVSQIQDKPLNEMSTINPAEPRSVTYRQGSLEHSRMQDET